jgi:hypothetical protein
VTIDSHEMAYRDPEAGARRLANRGRTVTAFVLLTTLGAGGLAGCSPSARGSGSENLPDGWEEHSASGLSFALPSDWDYHEGVAWPGAWTPPDGDGEPGKGPSVAVHTMDLMGGDYGTGAAGQQVDVPGADGAEYWHHDIPPEGGDLHEIVVTVSDWVGVRIALTAGDLSDAESRDLFENVAGSLRVDGEVEDDYEAAQRFGSYTDLKPTGEAAALPDLGNLPTGIPDGWGFAGPQGFRIRLPDGWVSDPGTEEAAWIHPGTGARIRVDEADPSDTWELTREGTPFAMPGADIAVASASVVTDKTGQELVEVQVDVRREGGRGYTAFVDAPAADLADLLIPFLGSLRFQAEAGGTGWVNDLPEYPHLADPPASWAKAEVGFLRLAVPDGLAEEGDGFWTMGSGQDESLLAVDPMDAPIEKKRPGQTSVQVDGATSVLVVIVKDHDMGPDFFVGVAEIVLESGEVYSVAYHSPGIKASEKTFGQILGSLAVSGGS